MTPGRTLPNLRMAGQHGNKRVSVLNLRVARVLDDEGIVLVEGAVPGPKRGTVTVRRAVKAQV
jgi:large subunit ribosomal protein L3